MAVSQRIMLFSRGIHGNGISGSAVSGPFFVKPMKKDGMIPLPKEMDRYNNGPVHFLSGFGQMTRRLHRFFLFGLIVLFSARLHAQTVIESAFSPDDRAEALILQVIDSSKENLRLAAYAFTSPPVMKSLLAAKKRGVDVKIVVDEKGNRSKASKAAMNLMVNANIPLRTVSKYRIHHDKYIVVDGRHVETGSFNYSKSAARHNSENVVVIWNDPVIAKRYLKHWESRWNQGTDWKSEY